MILTVISMLLKRTVGDLVCPKNARVFGDPIVPYKFAPYHHYIPDALTLKAPFSKGSCRALARLRGLSMSKKQPSETSHL